MTFKQNIKLLNSYKARPNKNNEKIENIIQLYQEKKIPNIKTAEKAVMLLTLKHPDIVKQALDNYNKIFHKYADAVPMTGRLSRPGFLSVQNKNSDKPLSHIQIDIKTRNSDRFNNEEDGAEKLTFEEIFHKIKARLLDETADMLNHKKSMKIKLGVKFEIAKLEVDPFDDNNNGSSLLMGCMKKYPKN